MAHTSKTEVRQSKSIGFEPSSPPADSATVVASPGRSSALVDAAAGPAAAMVAAWLAAVLLTIHLSPSYALLIGLGFTGAFIAGLVGVGGAILMIPLLLYVPPLFGIDRLPFHTVAGVEMIQVATAGIVGALAHWREGKVSGALVATIGPGMVVAALTGAIVSRFVSAGLLTVVFASLALVAGLVMLGSRRMLPPETPLHAVRFNKGLAVSLGGGVGFLSGMVGAGGGFLLMALMVSVLRIPMRMAVGSSLGIVAFSGLAGAFGKAVTGQVDWGLALALVIGALPGARLGAMVSRRTRVESLALILGILIAIIAFKMWWDLLAPWV